VESRFNKWLSDGRNLIITLLSVAVVTLALMIAIATVSSITAPSPYERKDTAEAALGELRDRMNNQFQNQIIINDDLYSQLDEVESLVGRKPNRYERPHKTR
jgi:hypothetical protein